MTKCLMTGCDLYIEEQALRLHGDLHLCGADVLVFNGVLDNGEAAWTFGVPPDRQGQSVILLSGGDYFERRGIVTFPRGHAAFGAQAVDFLRKWEPNFKIYERPKCPKSTL